MKRWRVILTATAVVAVLLFFFLVPVPISRIRGVGLVESKPQALSRLFVRHAGQLKVLEVQPGDRVTAGTLLARFEDVNLEVELQTWLAERQKALASLKAHEREKQSTSDPRRRKLLEDEMKEAEGHFLAADVKVKELEAIRDHELVIVADRDGIIGQAPLRDEVGKFFDKADTRTRSEPLFTIHSPGQFQVLLPVETPDFNQLQLNVTTGEERPDLDVTLRVHGLADRTWKGRIRLPLSKSEMLDMPVALASKGGGPIAVRAQQDPTGRLVPQAQHYPVYIDIIDPTPDIRAGNMAQAKIHLRPETCASWVWRTINDMFNLKLL